MILSHCEIICTHYGYHLRARAAHHSCPLIYLYVSQCYYLFSREFQAHCMQLIHAIT